MGGPHDGRPLYTSNTGGFFKIVFTGIEMKPAEILRHQKLFIHFFLRDTCFVLFWLRVYCFQILKFSVSITFLSFHWPNFGAKTKNVQLAWRSKMLLWGILFHS